ncbi:hypothetical protein MVEN_01388000 [Mycena venus]|uniref:DUF6535 domain-containing protein n=1 Tax=Mycena venus TaxID=2733690 RepID=A0A8H6XWZ5_9AGAR|nr:hypothetical protein MVEN_01388000 [Mycena venus]
MYYLAAGERGSLEARGLERQRKFDGLRRWKFDAVMRAFPLLLQAGLLLFSTALSIYLRTIHKSLAIVVLFFTALGFVLYTALLISAVAAPDSPFQSPLAALVTRLLPRTLWIKLKKLSSPLLALCRRIMCHLSAVFTPSMSGSPILLPLFLKLTTEKNGSPGDAPAPIFDDPFPEPSPEVPAVSWVLEASTDPRVISLAAAMVPHLQWPSTMDARPHLNRLRDGLLACFDFFNHDSTHILYQPRDGMTLQGLHLGQAYCAFRWILGLGGPNHPKFSHFHPDIDGPSPQLANVVRNLAGDPVVIFGVDQESDTRWSLRVIPSILYADSTSRYKNLDLFLAQFENEIPSLDVQSFTDYLFCIHTFLSSTNPRDIVWMDKSQFQGKLVEQIFAALLASLQTNQVSMDITVKIIDTTRRLANYTHFVWDQDLYPNLRSPIFHFCCSLPCTEGWVGVVLAAGLLAKPFMAWDQHYDGDPGWIYKTLECVQTFMNNTEWVNMNADRVAKLFNALLHHNAPPVKEHIHLLLQALSLPGDISRHAAQLFFQDNIKNWFLDDELQHILQDGSLWTSLIRVFRGFSFLAEGFIKLGHTLASIPTWEPFIREKPSAWIMLYFYQNRNGMRVTGWPAVEKYNSVLSQLWNPDVGKYDFTDENEKALGLTIVALSKLWEDIDLDNPSVWSEILQILWCTSAVVLLDRYPIHPLSWEEMDDGGQRLVCAEITPCFITSFSERLHSSLILATRAINEFTFTSDNPSGSQEVLPGKKGVLENIARIMQTLGNKMLRSVADLEQQPGYWYQLREQFDEEMDVIEKLLD